jgi:uncharacterized protein (DUF486 family)
MWKTVALLTASNVFMTFAWYGHLRFRARSLIMTIVAAWLIALPEYCLQVPANRMGYSKLTGFQLKILQEVITLCVFVVFAWLYLGEEMRWNHAVSFALILAAVWFAFRPGL